MKAMVLAAGLGKRLRPITEVHPKAALPILNVPAAGWALAALSRAGVSEALVNLHHLPGDVVRALGDGREFGVRLVYSDEPIILGTGGPLRACQDFYSGEETFFVHNADAFHLFDLREAHERLDGDALMVVTEDPERPEDMQVEVDGERVTSIRGEPRELCGQGSWRAMFCGITLATHALIDALPKGEVSCLVRDGLIPMLRDGRRVTAWRPEGLFCDIGTVERYLTLNLRLLEHDIEGIFASRGLFGPKRLEEGVYAWPGARVARTARLTPPVLLGRATVVEGDATVGPRVVLGHGSTVASGAGITDAVVLEGVTVSESCARAVVWR